MTITTKQSFSLIEIIFVILIISIIASVAITKLTNYTYMADMAKIKSDIAIIQNGIIKKANTQAMSGLDMIDALEDNNKMLFENILKKPFDTNNAKWSKQSDSSYYVIYKNTKIKFTYNSQELTFLCDSKKDENCKKLIK